METEENKTSSTKNTQINHSDPHEDFCDLMFDMTVPNQKPTTGGKKGQNNQNNNNNDLSNYQKD